MFERYTEKARRVVFFARYEASQLGTPYIGTEHLLLGLVREYKGLANTFKIKLDQDSIRQEIAATCPSKEPLPTNIDLPLSEDSKRVLKYAADEADRLNVRHIGTEHLLLGLLRENKHPAAKLLLNCGASLAAVRETIAKSPAGTDSPASGNSYLAGHRSLRAARADTIEIHGARWNADFIRKAVDSCRQYSWHWHKRSWIPRDIVISRKSGLVSFDLTLAADSVNFELVKGGWKKDHCAVCHWELFESKDDPIHSIGYTNGLQWLCSECYEKFWERPDFWSSSYDEIT